MTNQPYLVLARKYRPQTFSEVYAQEGIVRVINNALLKQRIAHAYLFCGPRGVGKTTMARLLAKSLNCVHGPTPTPCNECQNCREITSGVARDVLEIDGASNTGVDDIRELQRELMYTPVQMQYKIYIIDEVHMLSKNAFNALLKTLEEPPDKVIFIFATTEPHKVLPTIISRCQRYDFKRIPVEAILARLRELCTAEDINIDDEALHVLAVKADGGMRDALSLLDQVRSAGSETIGLNEVLSLFGIVHNEIFTGVLNGIADGDTAGLIRLLHSILDNGYDLQEFITGLMEFCRNVLLSKIGVETPDAPTRLRPALEALAKRYRENDILYLISFLIKVRTDLKTAEQPVLIAETAFVKLSHLAELQQVEDLVAGMAGQPQPKQAARPTVSNPARSYTEKPVAAPVPQPVPVEKAELNNENWDNLWPQILDRVKAEKPLSASYLSGCMVKVEGSAIVLNTTSEMTAKILSQQLADLQAIFASFFNGALTLSVVSEAVKREKAAANSFADIKEKSPQLAEFINITGSVLRQ